MKCHGVYIHILAKRDIFAGFIFAIGFYQKRFEGLCDLFLAEIAKINSAKTSSAKISSPKLIPYNLEIQD